MNVISPTPNGIDSATGVPRLVWGHIHVSGVMAADFALPGAHTAVGCVSTIPIVHDDYKSLLDVIFVRRDVLPVVVFAVFKV